jgi:hypothetical protein
MADPSLRNQSFVVLINFIKVGFSFLKLWDISSWANLSRIFVFILLDMKTRRSICRISLLSVFHVLEPKFFLNGGKFKTAVWSLSRLTFILQLGGAM